MASYFKYKKHCQLFVLLVASQSVLNKFTFKPFVREMPHSGSLQDVQQPPPPTPGCTAQSSQGAQRLWQQQPRQVSKVMLTLGHKSDLFLPRSADENENRGGEGEREVG